MPYSLRPPGFGARFEDRRTRRRRPQAHARRRAPPGPPPTIATRLPVGAPRVGRPPLSIARVGRVALQKPDADGLALGGLAHAGLLAQGLGRADARAHAAHDVGVENRLRRAVAVAGGDLPDEQRNVDRRRAGLLAGGVEAEIAALQLDPGLVRGQRRMEIGEIRLDRRLVEAPRRRRRKALAGGRRSSWLLPKVLAADRDILDRSVKSFAARPSSPRRSPPETRARLASAGSARPIAAIAALSALRGVNGREPAPVRPARALLRRRRKVDKDRRRRRRPFAQVIQRAVVEMVADVIAGVGRNAGRERRLCGSRARWRGGGGRLEQRRAVRRGRGAQRRRDCRAPPRSRRCAPGFRRRRRHAAPPARSSARPRASAARRPRRTRRRRRRRRRTARTATATASPQRQPSIARAASHEALTVSPPNGSKPVTRTVRPLMSCNPAKS